MARRVGDQRALATVMVNLLWATWGPDQIEIRLELSQNLVQAGQSLRDDFALLARMVGVAATAAERGQGESAAAAFAELDRLVARMRRSVPALLGSAAVAGWTLQRVGPAAAYALAQGISKSRARAARTCSRSLMLMQRFFIAWRSGQRDEWESARKDFQRTGLAWLPAAQVGIAIGCTSSARTPRRGDRRPARTNGFRDFPRRHQLADAALLAMALERLNDVPRARCSTTSYFPMPTDSQIAGPCCYWGRSRASSASCRELSGSTKRPRISRWRSPRKPRCRFASR